MSVNLSEVNKIINGTYSVFSKTTEQLEKFKNLPKLDKSLYTSLHTDFLVPTDIVIDVDLFTSEITQYDNEFGKLSYKPFIE